MKFLKMLNNHFEEYLLVLLMVAEVIIVFAQVITRFILKSPLAWSEEIARYMFIWLVWIGAAYATKENKNIKIDLLSSKFTGAMKVLADIFVTVLFKVTYTVYASNSIATGSHMPMWIAWFSLPLSMALMTFRFIQNSVRSIKDSKKKGE